jgi:hypothetical protein
LLLEEHFEFGIEFIDVDGSFSGAFPFEGGVVGEDGGDGGVCRRSRRRIGRRRRSWVWSRCSITASVLRALAVWVCFSTALSEDVGQWSDGFSETRFLHEMCVDVVLLLVEPVKFSLDSYEGLRDKAIVSQESDVGRVVGEGFV